MNFAELDSHPVPRRVALTLGIAAAVAAAIATTFDQKAVILLLLLLVVVTTLLPEVVPAILLVGPAALHVLTAVWAGFTTRGDVLVNPIAYLPLLAALFGPPLVVTFVWRKPVFRASPLARSEVARALIVGMLILQVWLAIRLIGTPSPIYGITKTAGFLAFSFGPALYVLLVVRNALDAERVLKAVLVIGGSWIALLIGLALLRRNLDLYHDPLNDVFGGLNEVAGGIGARAGILFIAALGGVLAGGKVARALGLIALPLAAVALILSGHRDSLFATIAGAAVLLVLLLFWMRRGQQWIGAVSIGVVILLGAAVFLLAMGGALGPRFQDPLSSLSFQYRVHDQGVAINAWLTSPLIGHGTGSSAYFIGSGDQPKLGVINGIYPHNVTIELLLELGVLGAAIYLITVIEVARRAAGLLWQAGGRKWPLATFLALFVAAFVASQGGADLTIQNDLWLIGALLAAAAVAAGAEPVRQSDVSAVAARQTAGEPEAL